MKRLLIVLPIFAFVICISSCKEERTPEMNGPHLLVVISGDDQKGLIDTPLDEPIVVEAHNRKEEPIPGISFTANIVGGGGALASTDFTTDANGQAEIFWTMGHEPYAAVELTDENDIVTTISIEYNDKLTATDPRGDGTLYHAKEYCGRLWLTENARYDTEASIVREANPDEYYGRMYYPIEFARICPVGWHVPTDKEWLELEECLGLTDLGDSVQIRGTHGADMKTETDWLDRDSGVDGTGTNESAFNALPAGIYDGTKFKFFGKQAAYWSASQDSTNTKYLARILSNEFNGVERVGIMPDTAMSCRCVKNY